MREFEERREEGYEGGEWEMEERERKRLGDSECQEANKEMVEEAGKKMTLIRI